VNAHLEWSAFGLPLMRSTKEQVLRGLSRHGSVAKELDDIRHLYAHNYAGEADDKYFDGRHSRYVLQRDVPTTLSCGAQFDGLRLSLNLRHLRWYAHTVQTVLKRFS
jgi:hypothetical protein